MDNKFHVTWHAMIWHDMAWCGTFQPVEYSMIWLDITWCYVCIYTYGQNRTEQKKNRITVCHNLCRKHVSRDSRPLAEVEVLQPPEVSHTQSGRNFAGAQSQCLKAQAWDGRCEPRRTALNLTESNTNAQSLHEVEISPPEWPDSRKATQSEALNALLEPPCLKTWSPQRLQCRISLHALSPTENKIETDKFRTQIDARKTLKTPNP